MGNSVPIRISRELRDALGGMKAHKDESYDMLLRRKLNQKRSRKALLKSKLLPKLMPGKATKAVMGSDKKATREVLGY